MLFILSELHFNSDQLSICLNASFDNSVKNLSNYCGFCDIDGMINGIKTAQISYMSKPLREIDIVDVNEEPLQLNIEMADLKYIKQQKSPTSHPQLKKIVLSQEQKPKKRKKKRKELAIIIEANADIEQDSIYEDIQRKKHSINRNDIFCISHEDYLDNKNKQWFLSALDKYYFIVAKQNKNKANDFSFELLNSFNKKRLTKFIFFVLLFIFSSALLNGFFIKGVYTAHAVIAITLILISIVAILMIAVFLKVFFKICCIKNNLKKISYTTNSDAFEYASSYSIKRSVLCTILFIIAVPVLEYACLSCIFSYSNLNVYGIIFAFLIGILAIFGIVSVVVLSSKTKNTNVKFKNIADIVLQEVELAQSIPVQSIKKKRKIHENANEEQKIYKHKNDIG